MTCSKKKYVRQIISMSILRLIYGEQVFHIVGQKNLCSLIFKEHAQTIIFNYVSEKNSVSRMLIRGCVQEN
jgi:hypothetical protein